MPVPAGNNGRRVYATVADLEDLPLSPIPANAELLLWRASRDVELALLTAVYPVDENGFPTDPKHAAAFCAATVEQVCAGLADGSRTGLGGQGPQSFSIGGIAVTQRQGDAATVRRVGNLCEQAWLILAQEGLTNQAPGEVRYGL